MTGKMKAAVLYGPEDLRLESVDIPGRRKEDVLVQIRRNALCGSDIHFFLEGRLGPFVVDAPYIPGHEASGVIVEGSEAVASGGSGAQVGSRVAIEPGIPCRHCRHCKSGRYNLCKDVRFLSAPPENGTFAEYVSVPYDFVHALPDNVDDESGALAEPLSVAVHACNRAGITPGSRAAVLGVGPIGLLICAAARAYGAGEIFAVDTLPKRLDFAASHYANHVLDAKKTDVVEEIAELTRGEGVDFVFDASGASVAAASAPLLASRGGDVTLVGWPETATFPFPVEAILERELNVHGVNRYSNAFPTAIAMIANGTVNVRPLISHRFAFDSVVEAFHFASDRKTETIKVMINA